MAEVIDKKAERKAKDKIKQVVNRLETLVVEYVDINSIEPNSYNPNRQSDRDFELLKRSMTEDGFDQPVIVQRESQQIVDGEHRWRAARDLGYTQIPVVFVDMSAEQMRISTLRHNRARGSEDFELSAALLRDLRELNALDWAQDSLMLDDREVARLLDDMPVPERLAGDAFSEAWEPAIERPTDRPTTEAQTIEFTPGGQPLKRPTMIAASPEAVERLIAAQAELDAATTGVERYAIVQARQVYKLSLTFIGEEANIVKQVLGTQPAVTLLELCREEVGEIPVKEPAQEVPAEV